MVKRILLLLLFASTYMHAQHSVTGVMSPKLESDWLILYKLEGTKQVFVNNTKIKADSALIGGKQEAIGRFQIQLPANAKPGVYRATYRLEGAGFVDFYYNNEDVTFIFNPEYPQESIAFSDSEENKLYQEYLVDISKAQQKLDSIQVAVLQDSTLKMAEAYKAAFQNLNSLQNKYENLSKNKYVAPVIKASLRVNSPTILNSVNKYLSSIKSTFFDRLDFSNQTLRNSSFLTNRILDYIFYINYSDDLQEQKNLHKKSITTVLSKISDQKYKRDIIVFLIDQFESSKNIAIIDYLFKEHYNKLPIALQDAKFKKEKEALFATEIGRTAPDFSWTENGKSTKLSNLNDAENYVLVFWSTSCSHCLREIPQLHMYMKSKPAVKVVAFALENDSFVWETYKKANLRGWHNVLGLKKWENKVARTYQINATPTYFVLDKNKKIIAKPNDIDDVKSFLEKL
ncbi:TlpA disulfide reductase family protein [Polaribacter sp. MED152]|uniref:TlpA family protein disulfide reductase n=1 Tax=Polaribacter sp. MED152 TaxID=313598 RepID=UPI000186F465|nr:TlpA disulfide reductase family protein [Polaribacter sp. MED152]EAQ42859.2 AhpC/TSA family protein [Polaribacter sp. MED152]